MRRAIERDRGKHETPNQVLRRWLQLSPPSRRGLRIDGATVIRIDQEVAALVDREQRDDESRCEALARVIDSRSSRRS